MAVFVSNDSRRSVQLNDLRRVEIFKENGTTEGGYVTQLIKGDKFRLYDHTGETVTIDGEMNLTATSDFYMDNGVYTINTNKGKVTV